MMHVQVVHDQERLVFGILDQSPQHVDDALGVHGAFVDREAHQSLAGHGRDHRQTVAPGAGGQWRRLAAGRIAARPVGVVPHRCLVGPVNFGVFRLRAGTDHRLGLVEPRVAGCRRLLQRLPEGLLRRVAPATQILLPERADRHLQTGLPPHQRLHRPPHPQRERQIELIRTVRRHQITNAQFRGPQQTASFALTPTAFATGQASLAFRLVATAPCTGGADIHPDHLGHLLPGLALVHAGEWHAAVMIPALPATVCVHRACPWQVPQAKEWSHEYSGCNVCLFAGFK